MVANVLEKKTCKSFDYYFLSTEDSLCIMFSEFKTKIKMKRKANLFTKLIVCSLAAGLFVFNAKALAQMNPMTSELKISDLVTTVSADEEGSNNGGDKMVCGTEECEKTKTYGIPPVTYEITYHGHYSHCQNSSAGSCNSGDCDRDCDAG